MNPIFSNKTYDKLKFVALILLPAAAALYFGLAQVWGLPKAEEVVGTATVLDTFLGLLLGLSAAKYKNVGGGTEGDLLVQHVDGETYFGLAVKKDGIEEIPYKDKVTLRVVDDGNRGALGGS